MSSAENVSETPPPPPSRVQADSSWRMGIVMVENPEKARPAHLHCPGLRLRKPTLSTPSLCAELLSGPQTPTPQQVHCRPGRSSQETAGRRGAVSRCSGPSRKPETPQERGQGCGQDMHPTNPCSSLPLKPAPRCTAVAC